MVTKNFMKDVPMVNCPFLLKHDNEWLYAWKRAVDGKVEARGYYAEYVFDVAQLMEERAEWFYLGSIG